MFYRFYRSPYPKIVDQILIFFSKKQKQIGLIMNIKLPQEWWREGSRQRPWKTYCRWTRPASELHYRGPWCASFPSSASLFRGRPTWRSWRKCTQTTGSWREGTAAKWPRRTYRRRSRTTAPAACTCRADVAAACALWWWLHLSCPAGKWNPMQSTSCRFAGHSEGWGCEIDP